MLADLSWTDKMAFGYSLRDTLDAPIKEQLIMIDLLQIYLDKQGKEFRTHREF